MFGASRKKFVEGVDGDYHDENMYYSQPSMFPHRSEKDVSWISLLFPLSIGRYFQVRDINVRKGFAWSSPWVASALILVSLYM